MFQLDCETIKYRLSVYFQRFKRNNSDPTCSGFRNKLQLSPRHLLAALAAGVQVNATPACGLSPRAGLTLIPADDTAALVDALRRLCRGG